MDFTTSTTAIVSNSFFLAQIPAAVYVLIGVVISGIFSMLTAVISGHLDNKNSREIKELDNKNSREIKELEHTTLKESQKIEIEHNYKMQELKEVNDRNLRLLDQKMVVFSDFIEAYKQIFLSGNDSEIVKRTENLRGIAAKLSLLVPELYEDLIKLDRELVNYANFYLSYQQGKITTPKHKKKKSVLILSKIRPFGKNIVESLPKHL